MAEIPWMREGPLGVMVHWCYKTQPREGTRLEDWNAKVDAFRLDEFSDTIAATGARWLIFPITHAQATGFQCCTHNDYLESLVPGCCSQRDLLREIAQTMSNRGIRVLAYTGTMMHNQAVENRRLAEAFSWDNPGVNVVQYQAHFTRMLKIWSEHLGAAIAGWWFDGCYPHRVGKWMTSDAWLNQRFGDGQSWATAVRAGNPESVFAMNTGVHVHSRVLPQQDYLAGEVNDLARRCEQPTLDGLQWHQLVPIDCFWGHCENPGPIAPPKFSDAELTAWAVDCHRHGGAVTLNLGIYEDGTLPEASVTQVAEVASHISRFRPRTKLSG